MDFIGKPIVHPGPNISDEDMIKFLDDHYPKFTYMKLPGMMGRVVKMKYTMRDGRDRGYVLAMQQGLTRNGPKIRITLERGEPIEIVDCGLTFMVVAQKFNSKRPHEAEEEIDG